LNWRRKSLNGRRNLLNGRRRQLYAFGGWGRSDFVPIQVHEIEKKDYQNGKWKTIEDDMMVVVVFSGMVWKHHC
jgi:hypothetical protein